MKNLLTYYWIEIENDNPSYRKIGVTAFSIEDAKLLIESHNSFPDSLILRSVKENIKFEDLDQNHVVPNMKPITDRGIWYPII